MSKNIYVEAGRFVLHQHNLKSCISGAMPGKKALKKTT